MTRLKPLIQRIVNQGDHLKIDAPRWAKTHAVSADAITLCIAECIQEQRDIEALRAREPAIEGK